MNKKLKGRANPLAELHFIADVPLEQAVTLIGNLADDTHAVTLTEVDANNFKFEISSSSKINGTLQRWQGTETRVSCDGKIIDKNDKYGQLGNTLFLLSMLLVFLPELLDIKMLYVLPIATFCFAILSFAATKSNKNSLKAHNELLFRERDRLLQLVIDTFKSSGEVEAYDTQTQQQSTYAVNKR